MNDISLDRHRIRRQSVVAAALYLVATVGFLWFAVNPAEFSSRLQGEDSALMAMIMDHVSRALMHGGWHFWEVPIFYPVPRTLCLSEPMITPSILLAPVIRVFGTVAASDLWIYVCWWSLAMSAWLYLRHTGISALAAFWGGLFISFNCDRAWDLVGHDHLYFQAGLFLCLLAMERAILTNRWRWKIIFGAALLAQAFSGMYISVICAAWAIWIFPLSGWSAIRRANLPVRAGLTRCAGFILPAAMLTLLLYLPVLRGYLDFNQDFPQNLLARIPPLSATLSGYIHPPTTPGHLVTLTGAALMGHGSKIQKWEDSQFVGFVALALCIIGIARLQKRASDQSSSRLPEWIGIVAAGLFCFILSLGPYEHHHAPFGVRLPFAFLYAWIEPLRFVRAPARFATGVFWSIGIVGAWGLDRVLGQLETHHSRLRTPVGIACILLTALEIFPATRIVSFPAGKTDFTAWLDSQSNPKPYVQVHGLDLGFFRNLEWNNTPVVNGYSGYAPMNRIPELRFFDRHFPDIPALSLMRQWKVDRVFIPRNAGPARALADASSDMRTVWSGESGTFYELTTTPHPIADLKSAMLTIHATQTLLLRQPLSILASGRTAPSARRLGIDVMFPDLEQTEGTGWRRSGNDPRVTVCFASSRLLPAAYSHLKVKYRVSNWYKSREQGGLSWDTGTNPDAADGKIEFVIRRDGRFHELDIPVGQSIPWVAQVPINRLDLRLGQEAGATLDVVSIHLE